MKKHGEGAFNPAKRHLRSAGGCSWNDPPALAERLRLLATGGQDGWHGNFPAYALDRWGGKLPKTGLKALVVGGGGHEQLLKRLVELPSVASITVVENLDETDDLEERPASSRIQVDETDWENLSRYGVYHMAIADEALSRRPDLDKCLDHLRQALAFDGLLAIRDYVGPNRLQFGAEQVDLANALLALLPENLRRDVSGRVRRSQEPPPLDWLLENDPKAAICSEMVREAVTSRFATYEEADLGGTVLMPLLAGISHNFLDESPERRTLLDAFWNTERLLLDAGLIESDNWFFVGWNRARPARGGGDGSFIERNGE